MATIRHVSQGKNSRAKPIEAGSGLKTVGAKADGSEASSRDGQEAPGVPGFATTAVPGQISASNGSRRHGQHELTVAAKYRRVLAALYEALFPHFDYPSVARRRGWQGRVKVGLHVEADGDLSRIHLVESSGYALLDKAAVRNVTELRSVPGASQWLEGSDIDVVLPVSYQLNDY